MTTKNYYKMIYREIREERRNWRHHFMSDEFSFWEVVEMRLEENRFSCEVERKAHQSLSDAAKCEHGELGLRQYDMLSVRAFGGTYYCVSR